MNTPIRHNRFNVFALAFGVALMYSGIVGSIDRLWTGALATPVASLASATVLG